MERLPDRHALRQRATLDGVRRLLRHMSQPQSRATWGRVAAELSSR